MILRLGMLGLLASAGIAGAQAPEQHVFGADVVSQMGRYEFRVASDPQTGQVFYSYFEPGRLYGIGIAGERDGIFTNLETPPVLQQFDGVAVLEPSFSVDGKILVFNANQTPDEASRFDVWMSRRQNGDWQPAERLPDGLNSSAAEWYPSLAASGVLYLGSERPGGLGGIDLYRSDGALGEATSLVNLGEPVNSGAEDFDAYIDPLERFMIFISNRDGGFGSTDLYIALPDDAGNWSRLAHVGAPFNDSGNAPGAPMVSADGLWFLATVSEGVPDSRGDVMAWPLRDLFVAADLDPDEVLSRN